MTGVEEIRARGRLLAMVVSKTVAPDETSFLTEESLPVQLGFIVYPQGGEVRRHVHRPLERSLIGTSEVLLVRSGACEIDVYDEERALVATRRLTTGDVVVMLAGGHGFRMFDDTTFLEIKQGPYTGLDEKETF